MNMENKKLMDVSRNSKATFDKNAETLFQGEARIYGGMNEDLLRHEITLSFGHDRQERFWRPITCTVADFVTQHSTFQEGPKDGSCMLQGEAVDGVRNKNTIRQMDVLMMDHDTGVTLDDYCHQAIESGTRTMRGTRRVPARRNSPEPDETGKKHRPATTLGSCLCAASKPVNQTNGRNSKCSSRKTAARQTDRGKSRSRHRYRKHMPNHITSLERLLQQHLPISDILRRLHQRRQSGQTDQSNQLGGRLLVTNTLPQTADTTAYNLVGSTPHYALTLHSNLLMGTGHTAYAIAVDRMFICHAKLGKPD